MTHNAWDGCDLVFTMLDNAGIARSKLIPNERIGKAVTNGVGISPSLGGFTFDDHIAVPDTSTLPVGDMRMFPDTDAGAKIDDGLFWAPVSNFDQALNRMPTCARGAAQRLENEAKTAGYDYLMSFEHEFTLFDAHAARFISASSQIPGYGTIPFLLYEEFLRDLMKNLLDAGVEVEQIHPEYGDMQFEVSTAPLPPVAAADRAVLVRIITTRTALKHGFRTSFAPMTSAEEVGNGAHVHFSASKSGSNLFALGSGPFGVTNEGGQMIAGILRDLPAATAVFAPSVVSYERLLPGMWSGAWAAWGHENREVALRFISGTQGHESSSANCEVKIVDPSANPYLVVATILALSQRGISDDCQLVDPVSFDPAAVSEERRTEQGIRQLPSSLQDALSELDSSAVVKEGLGETLVAYFRARAMDELERLADKSLEERIDAMMWRY